MAPAGPALSSFACAAGLLRRKIGEPAKCVNTMQALTNQPVREVIMAETYSIDLPPPLWRGIDGYEGVYEISSTGAVRSLDRIIYQTNWVGNVVRRMYPGRAIKATPDNHGYIRVTLTRQGQKPETKRVHHLVAAAFLGPRPDGYDVCHNDGDKANNALSNLRYGSHTDNEADKLVHGTRIHGERHADAKMTDETVRRLRRGLGGMTQSWWARHLGVSEASLSRALSGHTWRHINLPAMRDPHQ